MTGKVGFIGMGIMGSPMALNVLRKGYELTVYNRSPEKCAALVDKGAKQAETPASLGQDVDVVVLMLTGPAAIDNIISGEQGLLAGIAGGKTVINMSTISPAEAARFGKLFQERDIHYIDAPVSGSKKPAEDGSLVILAGGDRERINSVEQLLLAMGKKILHCGGIGKGSAMKMAINLLLGIMMGGLCEATAFADKCGIDKSLFLQTVMAGPLSCGLFGLKGDMLQTGEFDVQFPLKHMAKDLGFVKETAAAHDAGLPLGSTLAGLYEKGVASGYGDLDFAAVMKIIAD